MRCIWKILSLGNAIPMSCTRKIQCADCESLYIGESGSLSWRLEEQKNDVAKGHTVKNALPEYAENTGHDANWHNARITVTEKNLKDSTSNYSSLRQRVKQTIYHLAHQTECTPGLCVMHSMLHKKLLLRRHSIVHKACISMEPERCCFYFDPGQWPTFSTTTLSTLCHPSDISAYHWLIIVIKWIPTKIYQNHK